MLKLVTTISLAGHDTEAPYDVDRLDRRALADLDDLPDRARVVVNVTGRRFITQSARHYLTRHLNRLEVTLEGDVATLRAWHDALLGLDEGAA